MENRFSHCKFYHSKYKHLHFIAHCRSVPHSFYDEHSNVVTLENYRRRCCSHRSPFHWIAIYFHFVIQNVSVTAKKLRLLFIFPFAKSEQLLKLMPSPAIWIENNINIRKKRKTSLLSLLFFFFGAFISLSAQKTERTTSAK